MNPEDHAKCPENPCTGPRCRAHTGKTKRKANYARPKPNKHEGSRITKTEGKKK